MRGGHDSGLSVFGGGSGQCIVPLVDGISDFPATNKELVILKLSYGYNTDDFYADEHNNLSQGPAHDLDGRLYPSRHRPWRNPGLLEMPDLITDRAADIVVVNGRRCRR